MYMVLVARGSQQHGQEVYQEGRARRRAQWQWAACTGFWQDRGGKKAAAAAKNQQEAEAKAKAEAARCVQKQRWQQWGAAHGSASVTVRAISNGSRRSVL